jgi:large subunit ribosomal protein L4
VVADDKQPIETDAQAADAAVTPKAKKPAAKTAAKKPAAKKPAAKATVAAKPAAKSAVAKPAAKKPAAAKAPVKSAAKPAAAKSAATKPAAKTVAKTATKAAAKPAAAKSAAKEPAAKKPAPKPAAKKVVAKPATRAARKPIVKHPAITTPGKATVIDAAGNATESMVLNEELFGVTPVINTLHLAVRADQAKRRRGTASTKTRGEVAGSTAKLYRQKGTGRARVGSSKSPTRIGGGTAFGPKPRNYEIKINRKVVRKAMAMALSDRAASGNVFVAKGLELETPSTAKINALLVGLDIAAPVLVVTSEEPVVSKSVRNLFYAETTEVGALSTEKILRARSLVLTEKAFNALNRA